VSTPDGSTFAYCTPVSVVNGTATFRVRIFDENRSLRFEARRNGHAAGGDPGWELIPATLVTQEISVRLAAREVIDVEKKAVKAQPLT
jgi:hypothetical protein